MSSALRIVQTTAVSLLLVSGLDAQSNRGAAPPAPPAAARPAPALERLSVQSDGHAMAVWARRPATPHAVILLVHGMTWSTKPDFDLQVPGMQRSVMAAFAAQGIAAYGVDLRGYGETPRDNTGWLTPRRAAADVTNVLTWIATQHPSLPKPALVGWSRGGAISAMAAQGSPAKVSALVLYGFVFDPEAQFVDGIVTEKPQMARNTPEAAASDFISPKVTPPAVIKAFVEQALKADPIRVDLKNDGEFNTIKPDKITVPTLVIYGQQDVISDQEAGKFFAALATGDKAITVLPGGDHAAMIEDTHDMWIAAIAGFVTRPPVRR